MRKSSKYLIILDYFLVFALTFVGDFKLLDFYLYPFLLLAYSIVHALIGSFSRIGLVLTALFGIFFFDLLLWRESDNEGWWKVFIIVTSPMWFKSLTNVLKTQSNIVVSFNRFLVISCTIYAVFSLSSGITRGSLFFGPNILYRVFFFLGTLELISFRRKYGRMELYRKGAILTMLMSTGSRLSLALIVTLFGRIKLKRLLSGLLLGFIIFFMLNSVGSRLLNFTGMFDGYRVLAYQKILDWDRYLTLNELIFGATSVNNMYHFYPHNLFLESLVEHGLVRTVILLVSLLIYVKKYLKNEMLMPLLGIYLGSFVSGSFFENAVIYSLGFYLYYESIEVNYSCNRI